MDIPDSHRTIAVSGIHGNTILLTVHAFPCTILDSNQLLEMAVSPDVQHEALLGRSCSSFYLLQRAINEEPEQVLAVQTRAWARHEADLNQRIQNEQDVDGHDATQFDDLIRLFFLMSDQQLCPITAEDRR